MGSGQGAGIQGQTLQQDVRWEGGDQQWRQEVKIAPASRPSSLVPGQDLGSGPGAILGPGRVTILGGRSPPSQAAVGPAQGVQPDQLMAGKTASQSGKASLMHRQY